MFHSMHRRIRELLEKRRHPRVHAHIEVQALQVGQRGRSRLDCLRMTDISRTGMGAICERPMEPGERMVLYLPIREPSGRRSLYATVRRCRPMGGDCGKYRLGLEFDPGSTDARCGRVSQACAA
jgi:hypothetical protein